MTTATAAPRKLTHAEFLTEASERFGKDPADWAFLCPGCGDTATGADFRTALEQRPREHKGKPVGAFDVLGQECIGRSLGALEGTATRGCNWVAYGLFPAPQRPTVSRPLGRAGPRSLRLRARGRSRRRGGRGS